MQSAPIESSFKVFFQIINSLTAVFVQESDRGNNTRVHTPQFRGESRVPSFIYSRRFERERSSQLGCRQNEQSPLYWCCLPTRPCGLPARAGAAPLQPLRSALSVCCPESLQTLADTSEPDPVGHSGRLKSPRAQIYSMWQVSFKTQASTDPKQIFPVSFPAYLNYLSLLSVIPSEMKARKRGREEQEYLGTWERKVKKNPKVILCSCVLVKKKYQVDKCFELHRAL